MVRDAANARLAEITRDAVPGTNPAWGVNRLTKELYDRGFRFSREADGDGLIYENPQTGDLIRIMERPTRQWRTDSPEKHYFDHYYRYKPSNGSWGSHVPIPNKD
jgi:hypothetical protein